MHGAISFNKFSVKSRTPKLSDFDSFQFSKKNSKYLCLEFSECL
jgi:hypothetical protein